MDNWVTHWINALAGQSDGIDAALLAASSFGAPIMVACVVSLWWLGSPEREVRHSCISGLAALLVGFALAHVWLLAGPRIRPNEAGITHLIVPLTPYRLFLSDHAIAATGIVFAFLLNRVVPVWTAILAAMALIVCFARVYVGLHYASDIFADLGVGLVSAIMVRAVYRPDSRIDAWLVNRL